MGLTLTHSRQVACWPWELRFVTDEAVRPGSCRSCERDVAVPSIERDTPVCLYCGLDSGLVEAVDRPLWSDTP